MSALAALALVPVGVRAAGVDGRVEDDASLLSPADRATVEPGMHPVAIEFEFVQPLRHQAAARPVW